MNPLTSLHVVCLNSRAPHFTAGKVYHASYVNPFMIIVRKDVMDEQGLFAHQTDSTEEGKIFSISFEVEQAARFLLPREFAQIPDPDL